MISNEQRREVAQKLRETKQECDQRETPWMAEDLMQALGFTSYEDGEENIFDRLADLIDRPTCELDHIDTDPAQDGYPLRLHECSNCRRLCYEIYGEFEYCPHCGAEVQE